jgi:uroporphyrinogen-III synthase
MDAASLDGLRVLVSRDRASSETFAARLEKLGATPIVCPCIEFVGLHPPGLDEALVGIGNFDWLVFTSANAVAYTFERIEQLGFRPDEHLSHVRVAVVGGQTASALAARSVPADLIPEHESSIGLAEALTAAGIEGGLMLLPTSRIARPELADALRRAGAGVVQLPVYDTVRPDRIPVAAQAAIERGDVDLLTFASPSAVRNFVDLGGGELLRSRPSICIGETTASAREAGALEVIVAPSASSDGMLDALLQFNQGSRREARTHG